MKMIEDADDSYWFGLIESMFGIPLSRFDGLTVVQLNTKTVSVVSAEIDIADRNLILSAGITLFSIKMAVPKLSTAAAMAFGGSATRMVLDVEEADADRFLSRDPIFPDDELSRRCDGQGYVVIRCRTVPLGLGFFRTERVPQPVVQSHFPKAWTLSEDGSAFDEE